MKAVTVIGCGIIGLTTAIKLQEKGFNVTIIAKEPYSKTLSSKVGAIWFPFEINPIKKANFWAQLTYKEYQYDKNLGNGVSFIPFITAYNDISNTDWTLIMPKGTVRKATKNEIPIGIKKAFVSTVPLAEPLHYLPHLFHRFIDNKGTFLLKEILNLAEVYKPDEFVVNCTGLGAKKLCSDNNLQPMRGQILRCKKTAISSFADSTKSGALTYVINRSNDCIIGGTDYINDWNLEVDTKDSSLILERIFNAGLAREKPEIIEEIVGLRPKRDKVRFEFDSDYPTIFHNYGHGGAGFTVAWGCATELANILSDTNA